MNKTWEEIWFEDIDYLREKLILGHKNIFFSIKPKEFEDKIKKLKSIVNKLDYEEMKVELSRIVASIRDAHTSITFPIKRFLPFKLYYYSDGIYIVNVVKGYEDLLYKKVVKIEDTLVKEVIRELSEIVSYENKYFFKGQSMKYIQAVDVLYGLLICNNLDKVNITTEDKRVEVNTVNLKELKYIENKNLPLYLEKSDENYWFKHVGDTLYIKYNSCREDNLCNLRDKIDETIKFLEESNIVKVTIDMRNNLGGDSTLIDPLIDFIKNNQNINIKGNLKVIIGRDTFSSALLNAYRFKWDTNAILVGEPSGGKPNCYGEILRFTLPNSKFNVSYSTRFYKLIDDDNVDALYPDEFIEEKIEERRNGKEEIKLSYKL